MDIHRHPSMTSKYLTDHFHYNPSSQNKSKNNIDISAFIFFVPEFFNSTKEGHHSEKGKRRYSIVIDSSFTLKLPLSSY